MKNIFVLLLFLTAASPANLLAKCKIKPPTRESLELFGKSVRCYPEGMVCYDESGKKTECPKETDTKSCFQTAESNAFTARFDNNGRLLSINVSDACQYYVAKTLAEKIIPPEGRGKFIKKTYISGEYECPNEYVEEYECLKINYSSQLCTGCTPGTVTITWN